MPFKSNLNRVTSAAPIWFISAMIWNLLFSMFQLKLSYWLPKYSTDIVPWAASRNGRLKKGNNFSNNLSMYMKRNHSVAHVSCCNLSFLQNFAAKHLCVIQQLDGLTAQWNLKLCHMVTTCNSMNEIAGTGLQFQLRAGVPSFKPIPIPTI